MHTLHQSGLRLPFFSSSLRSTSQRVKLFESSIPVHRPHSISISHSVTSQLYHPLSLNVAGFACRSYLHKSKLIPPPHYSSFIFISDPHSVLLNLSVPSLAMPATVNRYNHSFLLSISHIFSFKMWRRLCYSW